MSPFLNLTTAVRMDGMTPLTSTLGVAATGTAEEPTPYLDDISYLFFIWLLPPVVGIPGNILAIIVANRKRNKQFSPCIYMTAMGVADSVFLVERIMAVILNKLLLEYGIVTEPLWWFR
jgi:hypothetical protein